MEGCTMLTSLTRMYWLYIAIVMLLLQLTGCATYRDQVADGLTLMEKGQYQAKKIAYLKRWSWGCFII